MINHHSDTINLVYLSDISVLFNTYFTYKSNTITAHLKGDTRRDNNGLKYHKRHWGMKWDVKL